MMILPERTFDIWVALAVTRRFPFSLLWAPTTNAQADRERWDLRIALDSEESKVLFFENKGVNSSWNISIDMEQLINLTASQSNGKTIWYILPCFAPVPEHQRQAYVGGIQNNIWNVSRVFAPLEIFKIIEQRRGQFGQRAFPRTRHEIHVDDIFHYATDPTINAPTLREFLGRVATCEIGTAYRNDASSARDGLTAGLVMREIADQIGIRKSYQDVVQAVTIGFSDNEYAEWNIEESIDSVWQLYVEIGPKNLSEEKSPQIPMSAIIPYTPRS